MQFEKKAELAQVFDTPILFLVFNRIEPTKLVFSAIRDIKPTKLYIAADGPRPNKKGEVEKVDEVRGYILENIDWNCQVETLFRAENLGCKSAVGGAIDWFFQNEEMGIILEDDCLPSKNFFWFCKDLLIRYQGDNRIFMISGYNRQDTWKGQENDYFFSYHASIWGWATWRRSWDKYDPEMLELSAFSEKRGFQKLLGEKVGKVREKQIQNCKKKQMDTWDYPWAFAVYLEGALVCMPSENLVVNIGFGADATHTFHRNCDTVTRHVFKHCVRENRKIKADMEFEIKCIKPWPLHSRIINRVKFVLSKVLSDV